jgi:integrase
MRLKDYDDRDGKKVWLSEREMGELLEATASVREQLALILAGRCGLRRAEVVDVTPADVVRTDHGDVVRVWNGKGDKYREVPAPNKLITLMRGLGRDPDEALVDVQKPTVYEYVRRARERVHAELGDKGWTFVGPHDLRRSWGVLLLEHGVLPSVVMEMGGWENWQ